MKGDRLTIKQRQFAKEYVRSGNATEAVLKVYDTKKRYNARQIAKQIVKKEIVKKEITRLLDDSGLGLENNADKLKQAIDLGLSSRKATVDTALRGIVEVFKLHNAYPASRSIKLSYNRTDLVASKDLQATVDDLKRITERSNSLISSTE